MSKSGIFVKGNKGMTPVLDIMMLSEQIVALGFRTLFRLLINDNFTQSEFGII